MVAAQQQHVAVISGPVSEEDALYAREGAAHQSSLTALLAALARLGVRAEHVDPTSRAFRSTIEKFDVAFLNVHGPYGEDGRIQGFLDYLGIPYVNSGVMASAVGMDKLVTKAAFEYLRIPTPDCRLDEGAPATSLDSLPFMLKAADGGSSVGIELINDWSTVSEASERMRSRGFRRIFAEAFAPGRSVTVGVLERDGLPALLPPLEIVTERPFYDEASKLRGADGGAWYREPIGVGAEALARAGTYSERIYRFLECRGAVRVDFVISDVDEVLALEINTAPGLQVHSNLATAAAMAGIAYDDLILILLQSACQRANHLPWGR